MINDYLCNIKLNLQIILLEVTKNQFFIKFRGENLKPALKTFALKCSVKKAEFYLKKLCSLFQSINTQIWILNYYKLLHIKKNL